MKLYLTSSIYMISPFVYNIVAKNSLILLLAWLPVVNSLRFVSPLLKNVEIN